MTEDRQREQQNELVERIVREVLARLEGTRAYCGEATTNGTNRLHVTGNRPARRELTDRVITVDSLHGRVNGVGEITIRKNAVVTPAARDLLRDAAVRIVREGDGDPQVGPEPATLIVGVAECVADVAAVTRLKEVHAGGIQHVARMGLVDVVHELAEQVALGGGKGVVFTDNAAAAVCLANRRKGVRAVMETSAESVESAVASVDANVLVIRLAGLTTWQQLQMVRVFVSCHAVCPNGLAVALG